MSLSRAAGILALAIGLLVALAGGGAQAASLQPVGAGFDEPIFLTSAPDNPDRCELLIVRGDLLTALPNGPVGEAIETYEQSARLAEDRQLRMTHLRAATRLARMKRGTASDASARDALAAVYQSFTEGFDAADLIAARAVLDQR